MLVQVIAQLLALASSNNSHPVSVTRVSTLYSGNTYCESKLLENYLLAHPRG